VIRSFARAEDVRDIVTTILDALVKGEHSETPTADAGERLVFVTPHLHPSAVMQAQRAHAAGFVTESKAVSSHGAILLKGFGIPALGRVKGLMEAAREGDDMIVDARAGKIILRPGAGIIERYVKRRENLRAKAESIAPVEFRTADGTAVRLMGNIGNPAQATLILQKALEGVGLFRTEFFALQDGAIPGEEEQIEIYRQVIQTLNGRRLTVRTFDIGADKQVKSLRAKAEQNPSLGVRGIRRHLQGNGTELTTQLRAILRAAHDSEIAIMIPMVTTLRDVRQAGRCLNKAIAALEKEGLPHSESVTFGAMIETPAAALIVADILGEVDFVSLGTNDLLQYFMAADRDNEDVIDYNDASAPAFRKLLQLIISEAIRVGRQDDVTICGEVASRRHQIPVLLRMGYRSFSISPVMADDIREAIAQTDLRS